jgi:hypothetical protein
MIFPKSTVLLELPGVLFQVFAIGFQFAPGQAA